MGATMGMLCGRISEETPKHTVLKAGAGFEIRRYAPSVCATTDYASQEMGKDAGGPFGLLARYIGVFSDAQNRAPGGQGAEKIAMTAPVLMGPAGGAPEAAAAGGGGGEQAPMLAEGAAALLTDGRGSLSFLLPAKYGSVAEAPVPTDSRIVLRQLPERTEAVATFTWALSEANIRTHLVQLLADLADDDEWQAAPPATATASEGEGEGDGGSLLEPRQVQWTAAGFNPPFTLPWWKTNEVMTAVVRRKASRL